MLPRSLLTVVIRDVFFNNLQLFGLLSRRRTRHGRSMMNRRFTIQGSIVSIGRPPSDSALRKSAGTPAQLMSIACHVRSQSNMYVSQSLSLLVVTVRFLLIPIRPVCSSFTESDGTTDDRQSPHRRSGVDQRWPTDLHARGRVRGDSYQ